MSRSDDADDTVRRRSGWLIPLGVFVVTLALSAMFLLFYLAPTPPPLFSEQVSPTSSTEIVSLEVNGLKLWVPANYFEFDSARRGGTHREVALFAKLPTLTGWSNWDAQSFDDNASNSRIVYLLIRDERLNLSEAERLRRVYLAYVADPKGKPGPFGLTQYAFLPDSGYRGEDLFVGETPNGPAVLRCVRYGPDVPSPSCLRDIRLARGVALSYRFKRAQLKHWRDIGDGVDKLMALFQKPPAK